MEDGSAQDCVVDKMMPFAGEVVTIRQCMSKYKIDGSNFSWTDGMFAGLADEACINVEDLL